MTHLRINLQTISVNLGLHLVSNSMLLVLGGSKESRRRRVFVKMNVGSGASPEYWGGGSLTDLYEVPDAVPPIHAVSSHVATDKDPSK